MPNIIPPNTPTPRSPEVAVIPVNSHPIMSLPSVFKPGNVNIFFNSENSKLSALACAVP